jgi:hypothetical protein
MRETAVPTSPTSHPIGWAVYLGMSWTWVIGMFLPVILIRDYGLWAWVIFAIPNCLGAAAMGWVMRSRTQSVKFTQNHAIACRVFSLVTIAFHLFVTSWLCPMLIGTAGWIVPAVLAQAAFTPLIRGRAQITASVVTLIASIVIAIGLFTNGGLSFPTPESISAGSVIGLSMVCLLGFILCPYLDLTFHRARQSTSDAGAKVAFGTGFCVVFASMIVLTLGYAASLAYLMPGEIVGGLIFAQISVQSVLTVILHARALHDQAESRDDAADFRATLGTALGVGLLGGMGAYFAQSWSIQYAGLSIGEVIYRSFLAFYGLIAPAYLLVAIACRSPRWGATAIVVLIALPMYWLAFVERHMPYAIVGVSVVLIASTLLALIPGKSKPVEA